MGALYSLPAPALPALDRPAHEDQVLRLLARCEGAYAQTTLKGYRNDLTAFAVWCVAQDLAWLPASPQTLASYIDAIAPQYAAASVRRRICAIQFAHVVTDAPSPVATSCVRLALRRAGRASTRRQAQSQGMTASMLSALIAAMPPTLVGVRDAALLGVGYDALCRSCEIAALRVENIRRDGATLSLVIARSKADPLGEGRLAWLSPASSQRLGAWLEASGLQSGPLFRSLHLGRLSERPLDTSSIRKIVQRAARAAGVGQAGSVGLAGHSMRIGAAQDMMTAGFDILAIMQAGGWKSSNVVARYVEHAATRSLHDVRWLRLGVAPES